MKKKHAKSKVEYPFATIAFYGPDNKHASKVVVGIITDEKSEPEPLERWVSGQIDVRRNPKIGEEIKSFLDAHHVKRVIVADGIIGCPHEEGEDYPMGTKCPFCSFWLNRNRFTHKIEDED
ncbi:MAG: hypothetical protein NTZ78_04335 [Candidatus Aureabacteria bacterium]|nr:hypothetical protein [Candidatus Auribacterota bacterium]